MSPPTMLLRVSEPSGRRSTSLARSRITSASDLPSSRSSSVSVSLLLLFLALSLFSYASYPSCSPSYLLFIFFGVSLSIVFSLFCFVVMSLCGLVFVFFLLALGRCMAFLSAVLGGGIGQGGFQQSFNLWVGVRCGVFVFHFFSAILSFALRLRGFFSCSSSEGTITLLLMRR